MTGSVLFRLMGMNRLPESFHPGLEFGLGSAVQRLPGLPVDIGIGGREVFVRLVDGAVYYQTGKPMNKRIPSIHNEQARHQCRRNP